MPSGVDKHETTKLPFAEIAAEFGEEAAITAGIAGDPDARELTDKELSEMRPAAEVLPHLVAKLA